jgi:hypothetical protein
VLCNGINFVLDPLSKKAFFRFKTSVKMALLKIWHGEQAHDKGLNQLADYLDRLDLDTGYLVIFDHNKKKNVDKRRENNQWKAVALGEMLKRRRYFA